jgi:hypothetical protein
VTRVAPSKTSTRKEPSPEGGTSRAAAGKVKRNPPINGRPTKIAPGT